MQRHILLGVVQRTLESMEHLLAIVNQVLRSLDYPPWRNVSKYQEHAVAIQKDHLSLESEKLKILKLCKWRREEQRGLKEAC